MYDVVSWLLVSIDCKHESAGSHVTHSLAPIGEIGFSTQLVNFVQLSMSFGVQSSGLSKMRCVGLLLFLFRLFFFVVVVVNMN